MPPNFFIKPAIDGLIVRDPLTRKPLLPEGESKPMGKYWLTREAEESVVRIPDPSEQSAKPKRSTATSGGEQ